MFHLYRSGIVGDETVLVLDVIPTQHVGRIREIEDADYSR